ncbi:uncharacterized protein LOC108604050 [Drosophila busckii]|uniref:uncharacterized protein LOC108604050 n=1 Tax=Drosophila busckii TaxID=30019 RepID=UPI00083ECDA1|nr:uncharacterized protein LOC108604050 [Drosophila busckii]
MSRRCVVCGNETVENPCPQVYHYPKTTKEAQIWQRSMGAFETNVECIKKYCCVCIDHIPQFVEMAKEQAALIEAKCKRAKEISRSVSVLLLPGAVMRPDGVEKRAQQEDDCLDGEIIILKSSLADAASSAAAIDLPEVTLLRTPVDNNEDSKNKNDKNNVKKNEMQCGDIGDNCTDVLLLGCSKQPPPECPCKCKQCPKSNNPPQESNYCQPQSTDNSEVTCGCSHERQIRQELGEIIRQQQCRICELECMLARQQDFHLTLQKKISNLYSLHGMKEES